MPRALMDFVLRQPIDGRLRGWEVQPIREPGRDVQDISADRVACGSVSACDSAERHGATRRYWIEATAPCRCC